MMPRPSTTAWSFAEFLDEHEDLRWYHDKLASAALAKIPGVSPLATSSPGRDLWVPKT